MKSINRIVLLALAAVAITMFWLVPGINKATAVEYTRVYEDTDYYTAKDTSKHQKEKKVTPPKGPGKPEEELKKKEYKTEKDEAQEVEKYPHVETAKPKKVYKSEKIRPKDRKARLNAKMFSRAVQFVEEVPLDSTEVIVVADTASTRPAPF